MFLQVTHALKLTTVVSLLQPPPEVYELFDDVMLLTSGQVFFHGPVPEVLPFLESVGFPCPQRKDVPSFLIEITTAMGQREYASFELQQRCKATVPDQLMVSIEEMVQHFREHSPAGRRMAELLARPFDKSKSHPKSLERRPYALGGWRAVRLITQRQFALIFRDRVLLKGRMLQVALLGTVLGSLFLDLPNSEVGARSFFGASFMSVLLMATGSFPQVPVVIAQKPVWFKHREARFYSAFAQAMGMAVASIPLACAEAFVYTIITYFM